VLVGRDRIGLWTGIVRALAARAIHVLAPRAAPIVAPSAKGR